MKKRIWCFLLISLILCNGVYAFASENSSSQSYSDNSVTGFSVVCTGDEGSLPSETVMKVSPVSTAQTEKIKSSINEYFKGEQSIKGERNIVEVNAIQIDFVKDGNIINPEKPVHIKLVSDFAVENKTHIIFKVKDDKHVEIVTSAEMVSTELSVDARYYMEKHKKEFYFDLYESAIFAIVETDEDRNESSETETSDNQYEETETTEDQNESSETEISYNQYEETETTEDQNEFSETETSDNQYEETEIYEDQNESSETETFDNQNEETETYEDQNESYETETFDNQNEETETYEDQNEETETSYNQNEETKTYEEQNKSYETETSSIKYVETEVSGKLGWNDSDNQDGLRPDNVTIYLIANGDTIDYTEINEGEFSFKNLRMYDEYGKKIKYSIEVESKDGYTKSIETYESSDGVNSDVIFTHEIEMIKVQGSISWSDKDNQDGLRKPFTIFLKEEGNTDIIKELKVSENERKYCIDNLRKYEKGKKKKYYIEVMEFEGYKSHINGFNINNVHIPETIDIVANIIWKDNNNKDARPDKITLFLKSNGKKIDEGITTKNKKWMHSFEFLPKYEYGKEIKYEIEVLKDFDGYEPKIENFNVILEQKSKEAKPETKKNSDHNNNKSAPTGDKTHILPLIIIMVVCMGSIIGLIYYKNK